MAPRLELIREEKLFRLIPGRKESSRLEASGVALLDENTALVVFDNLNQIARIDLSLKNKSSNQLVAAPSLGSGFEDISIDTKNGHALCLIETVEDFDGLLRGFVAEYDSEGGFVRCTRLPTRFQNANKGFEGVAHVRRRGREYLYALCEGIFGTTTKRGPGRVDVFVRAQDGGWKASHQIRLPNHVEFEDFAALAYHESKVAIVSQASARIWVAKIDAKAQAIVASSDKIYRFPTKSYGNVEGIAWLSNDTLVAVSDRRKKQQPNRCAEKDQSIHLFRIPTG
jgi:hypothetical protein